MNLNNPDSSHSLILKKSSNYQGPQNVGAFQTSLLFNRFRIDPLYCYPTLTYASTKTINNHAIIPQSEFTYPIYNDLKEVINEICQLSPFKTLEHTSPEVTYSSINTIEFGLDRFESESNKLTSTKKALVKQLLQDLGKKDDLFSSEYSINLDISESERLDLSSLYSKRHNSFSSVSSKSIFCLSDAHPSILPTNEEELITCSKESCVVELLAEYTNESNAVKNSIDSSCIDEGSLQISTRMFLPKACASKNILNRTPKNREIFNEEYIFVKDITLLQPEAPTVISPIHRKLVLCCQGKKYRTLEIKSCICCSGFLSCAILEFSNIENQSRGIIQCNESKITKLFSERVIRDLSDRSVSWISFGFEHCSALTSNGKVFSWGYGASGCLGLGSLLSCTFPTQVSRLPNVVYLECGAYHTAVISVIGEIFVWGRGDVNQLGVSFNSLVKDQLGYFAPSPVRVEFFKGKKIKTLACGEDHTLVVDSDGALYSFGWAEDGQLGLPSMWIKDNYMSYSVRRVVYLKHKKIVKVSAGALFSIAITERGEIYSWGNGELGQLGLGNTTKTIEVPTVISSLDNEIIVEAICGESHVICVSKNGALYGWGQGIAGIFEMRSNNFPYGSEVVCYLPRKLTDLDISHRFVIT